MGLIQDFLRNLREQNKQPDIEELYDERTKDRQLLLLRKEHRLLQEEREKQYLKEQLRAKYKDKLGRELFGFKTTAEENPKIIRAWKRKQQRANKCQYLGKYNMKGNL